MREILFRGKLKSNGEWVTGNLMKTMHETFINDIKFIPAKSIPSYHFAEVYPETVGQYTGLKDKNGQRYFIGDKGRFNNGDSFIIKMEDWLQPYIEWIGEPECEDQARDLYRISNAEITGSIHDKQGE